MALSVPEAGDHVARRVLDDDTCRQVLAEFHRREFSTVRQLVATHCGVDVSAIDRAALQQSPETSALLERAWTSAAKVPDGGRLVALYLYLRAQRLWEETIVHESVQRLLDAAVRTWAPGRAAWDEEEADDVDVLLAHAETLRAAMAAENALQCSCPAELFRTAFAVEQRNAQLLARLEQRSRTGSSGSGFPQVLREVVEAHEQTYAAVARTALTVRRAVESPGDALTDIDLTIADIRERESLPCLRTDVYASELRAHRFGLQHLRDRIRDHDVPELVLRDVRFVYVYPFTLDHVGADDPAHVSALLRALMDAVSGAPGTDRPTLADEPVLDATSLQLTDLWSFSASREPVHGLVLTLPELCVITTDPRALTGYTVQVRLTERGAHYVRIAWSPTSAETDVDVPPSVLQHEIHKALRRAGTQGGDELVMGAGSRVWSRLADYADAVVTDLAAALTSLTQDVSVTPAPPGPPPDGVAGAGRVEPVIDIDADLHVLIEIRQATVEEGGVVRDAQVDDLTRGTAALLVQPVSRFVTALEDWVSYPGATHVTNLLQTSGRRGDLATTGENSTVLFLPGSPSWRWLGYEEMVEFGATAPPLLRSWLQRLTRVMDQVSTEVAPAEHDDDRRDSPDLERHLEHQRMDLLEGMARIRDARNALSAVQSPGHRLFLANLLSAVGVPRLDRLLEERFAEADLLYQRVIHQVRRQSEERTAAYQRLEQSHREREQDRQAILALLFSAIGVASIAEVIGLYNAIFAEQVVSRRVAWVEAAIVVGLLIWALVVAVRSRRRRRA